VGILLLGGKTRSELSDASTSDQTVTSTATSPVVRVVRLPQPAERSAAEASLASAAR